MPLLRAYMLGIILCCLFVSAQTRAQDTRLSRERPNIVFVLLDNIGQEWFGCYGSEENCTPNIDQLASQGLRFEHCYAYPVCGPSRVTLLTGRQPYRTGFTLHHDAAFYGGPGLDPSREVSFARLFSEAGYSTGISGKWQINNLYEEPGILKQHGFEESLVWPGSVDRDQVTSLQMDVFRDAVQRESAADTRPFVPLIESRYWDPVFLREGKRELRKGEFGPDIAQAYAIDFLKRHRDQPFLLYYPIHLAHGQSYKEPVVATPLNLDTNRPHRDMYADMIRYADKLVGDLARSLEELGLSKNTVLFVASDNGSESTLTARRSGREVRGGLYSLSEAGSNVALVVSQPGVIAADRVLPLADFSDILPTMCELADIPPPRGIELDGKSFAPQLRGESETPHRDWIFNQMHTLRVVRNQHFKLYSDGRFYNANADPEEAVDIASSTEEEASMAREELKAVLDSLPPDAPAPVRLRSQAAFKIYETEKSEK